MSMKDKRILRASEIGEYVFCHRAWWLRRVKGVESANREQMQAGTAHHAAHGRAVQRSDSLQRLALILIVLAIFFAAMFVLSVAGLR